MSTVVQIGTQKIEVAGPVRIRLETNTLITAPNSTLAVALEKSPDEAVDLIPGRGDFPISLEGAGPHGITLQTERVTLRPPIHLQFSENGQPTFDRIA